MFTYNIYSLIVYVGKNQIEHTIETTSIIAN